MKLPLITILVNTSDSFEDCWPPFFKLFSEYWPNCNYPILLNTEFKEFQYPNLNIKSAMSNSDSPDTRLTWSSCLINAIHQIQTPIVLYLQEDYYLDAKVNIELIEELAELLEQNEQIKYIGLTDSGNYPPFKPFEKDHRLWEVSKNAKYRISTQAGLWKKDTLISYLKPDENGWMFEIFGSIRAKKRNDLFLTVNRELYNKKENPVFPYILTGIIKGKWHVAIPELFTKHQIQVDFSKRGFYIEKSYLLRKIETFKMLLRSPLKFYFGITGK